MGIGAMMIMMRMTVIQSTDRESTDREISDEGNRKALPDGALHCRSSTQALLLMLMLLPHPAMRKVPRKERFDDDHELG